MDLAQLIGVGQDYVQEITRLQSAWGKFYSNLDVPFDGLFESCTLKRMNFLAPPKSSILFSFVVAVGCVFSVPILYLLLLSR